MNFAEKIWNCPKLGASDLPDNDLRELLSMHRHLKIWHDHSAIAAAIYDEVFFYTQEEMEKKTGVTGHGLPQDRSSGGGSVLRINPPPGVSVLGQKLLPQDQSSPILR